MRPPARVSSHRPQRLTASLLGRHPLPSLEAAGSKEDRGKVLVIGGTVELPGAVLLAGTAALRAGAGKLQIATVKSVAPMMALQMPEAKVIGLPSKLGAIASASPALLAAARVADAIVIGCGMDASPSTARLVERILETARCPVVLDAGAIKSCLHKRTKLPVLITPHLGEMAEMTGIGIESIEADQLAVAQDFAKSADVFLALKHSRTIITEPSGAAWSYDEGPVGLGTSGSGDVLAGVVAGLLARGAEPLHALLWAVRLHGDAGITLTRRIGHVGFLARELSPELPPLLNRYANKRS